MFVIFSVLPIVYNRAFSSEPRDLNSRDQFIRVCQGSVHDAYMYMMYVNVYLHIYYYPHKSLSRESLQSSS